MKRLIKKIIRIILILMVIVSLLTACTYKAYAASAAGVVVAGGSIGTGGAAVGLLGLMGPITAILGVALASYGIYAVLDSSAEEEGVSKTEFIYSKFTEYNEQRNLSDEAMQELILEGATILKNGAISISQSASAYIKGFLTYMFGSDQIVSPDAFTGSSTVILGGVEMPVFVSGEEIYIGTDSSKQGFTILNEENVEGRYFAGFKTVDSAAYFVTNKPGIINFNVSPYSVSYRKINDGLYVTSQIYSPGCPFPTIKEKYPGLNSYQDFCNAIANEDFTLNGVSGDIPSSLVGDESIYNDRSGTLSPSADENTVFTPPLVDGLSGAGNGTISISDYLDAINDLLNEGEADIPIADPVTDVVTSVAVTDVDLTDTIPTVDPVEEQDNIGATVVIDPDLPVKPDTNTINSLAFDLREIFPFCIPFDLYNLLSKFVAEPESPYWEISIPLPMNLPAFEFVIDLSGFESVGVVLRSFEMVLFVASLAVATRSIYLRG